MDTGIDGLNLDQKHLLWTQVWMDETEGPWDRQRGNNQRALAMKTGVRFALILPDWERARKRAQGREAWFVAGSLVCRSCPKISPARSRSCSHYSK